MVRALDIRTDEEIAADREFAARARMCLDCLGAGQHFAMKEGRPSWTKCAYCEGTGITHSPPLFHGTLDDNWNVVL